MKSQWMLILGLLFALLIAVFAVFNVDPVEVDFLLFGTTSTPLILVILFSTLLGGLAVGFLGLFRFFKLQRKVKQLEKQLEVYRKEGTSMETAADMKIEHESHEEGYTPERDNNQ